jgi:hypothetical protein
MRLTTSTPSRAECHEIWEPKSPGTLWATPGLLRDCFIFYILVQIELYPSKRSELHTYSYEVLFHTTASTTRYQNIDFFLVNHPVYTFLQLYIHNI